MWSCQFQYTGYSFAHFLHPPVTSKTLLDYWTTCNVCFTNNNGVTSHDWEKCLLYWTISNVIHERNWHLQYVIALNLLKRFSAITYWRWGSFALGLLHHWDIFLFCLHPCRDGMGLGLSSLRPPRKILSFPMSVTRLTHVRKHQLKKFFLGILDKTHISDCDQLSCINFFL